jgi:hypothetical protein
LKHLTMEDLERITQKLPSTPLQPEPVQNRRKGMGGGTRSRASLGGNHNGE